MKPAVAIKIVRQVLRMARAAERFHHDITEVDPATAVNRKTLVDGADDALTALVRAAHAAGRSGMSIDNWIARVMHGADSRRDRARNTEAA